jgi:hypothetical protein
MSGERKALGRGKPFLIRGSRNLREQRARPDPGERINVRAMKAGQMPLDSGRMEKRFSVAVSVRVASLDRPWLAEPAMTENVSLFGARILVKDAWRPNEHVVVESPGGLYPCQARVVYCQALKTGITAIGLRLARARRDWVGGGGQRG